MEVVIVTTSTSTRNPQALRNPPCSPLTSRRLSPIQRHDDAASPAAEPLPTPPRLGMILREGGEGGLQEGRVACHRVKISGSLTPHPLGKLQGVKARN